MKKNRLTFIIVIAILAIFFIVTIIFSLTGKKKAALPAGTHGAVVKEVLQTGDYTYLNVDEDGKTFWMAISSAETKPGDSVYFTRSMEMKDFKSRELNRTFASILFVDDPSPTLRKPEPPANRQMTPQKVAVKKWSEVSVTVPKGGITLEQLYKSPGNYAGKPAIIRGVVTRFNSQIMNKNWAHIQDGTEFGGKFDLTVTTRDSLVVGQQATFTGTISMGKDFGAGYFYEVIMEEAKISDVK
jgi:hypothetical protein